MALALAAAQLDAQMGSHGAGKAFSPTLGWIYFSEHYQSHADGLLSELQLRWPGTAWVGGSAIGVCATATEYFDEPALVLMLCDLPQEQFQIFSGIHPLRHWPAETALVHSDSSNPDLPALLDELAVQTHSQYLFGGITSGRMQGVQIANGVWQGGLSGVAFGPDVSLVSRVSQGCRSLGRTRHITQCERNLVLTLNDQPALDCLMHDLTLPAQPAQGDWRGTIARLRHTLVALHLDTQAAVRAGSYGDEVLVRHLLGIDPARRGILVADVPELGQPLSFCERNAEAARRDLMRICTEIREELEDHDASPVRMSGAIYISCSGRGGAHFGAPHAELQWIQHALGDMPLAGFFAGGEIAHQNIYGYTGVLTVFLSPA
ncbi:MAG: FIST C-terminal domain-containing protein [Burkholderiaceae bacterium]|nr:FIST C-terminal domain-containing protein [Roseateles sp.]MBV8471207.1 FIST C-terminal domain-containing protein [Burkholderiaceae bacterium]